MTGQTDEGRDGGAGPSDPFIDEVREWRRTLWERFGDDPDRVYAYLRELERAQANRLVRAKTEDGRNPR